MLWQYSGKEVRVRLCAGSLEIYHGEMLLAKHKAQYRSVNVVFLQGQYSGLVERNEVPVPCAGIVSAQTLLEAAFRNLIS